MQPTVYGWFTPDWIKIMKIEELIPVEGKEGWYRDPETNAIVNASQSEYDKYMATYNKRQKQQEEQTALQKEVSELKSEMGDIKSLLLTLVNKEQGSDHGS